MKTTFSRQFALIAALLLVCMIFTGVSFRFLMLGHLKSEKREQLALFNGYVKAVYRCFSFVPFCQLSCLYCCHCVCLLTHFWRPL